MRKTACLFLSLVLFPALLPGAAAETRASGKKIGLALSGGGARGAAHIGVLKVLEREGIPVHCIAGTSFGSLVGGLYALGYKAAEIEEIFAGQDWNRLFSDSPERTLSPLIERKEFRYQGRLNFEGVVPELPSGFWEGQRLMEVLNSLTTQGILAAEHDFDRLPIPFRAVATNLLNGEPHVFRSGRLSEALRASIAIPLVFTPVEKDGMLLVDGGLANNLPVDIVRSMGADVVIAVDVTSPLLKKEEIRNFVNVIDQSISLLMMQSIERNRKLADIVLQPELQGITYSQYEQMGRIVDRGLEVADQNIEALRALVAGASRPLGPGPPALSQKPVIDSITIEGLSNISRGQLNREVRVRAGEPLDPQKVQEDVRRLYGTNFFDRVDYDLAASGQGRYHLRYLTKESPLNTLGGSIRYDRDYQLVALGELTARQLFNTPSVATFSTQFGGLENHSAALRYVPLNLPFLYVEPKVQVRRRERLDLRSGRTVDKFGDRRTVGQLMLGGTFLKRLEVEFGYRTERVSISGGTEPNVLDGAMKLAGIAMRLNRDTLDSQEFPSAGMLVRIQVDKRSEALGGDLSYSRWQADVGKYVSFNGTSTLQLRGNAGYSRGPVPFFDRFYLGGYSFSDGGPRHFVGFKRDELPARQMAVAGADYRHQVYANPLGFIRRGFVTVHFNVAGLSDRTSSPYDFRLFAGGGIGIALDTLLGPVRLNSGWGGGNNRLYMTLGPSF